VTDFETTNLRNLQNSQLYDSVLETMNGRQNLVKIDHSENEENKPCFLDFLVRSSHATKLFGKGLTLKRKGSFKKSIN